MRGVKNSLVGRKHTMRLMTTNFDALWDYSKPAETEAKFRALLPEAEQSGDRSYHAQVLTQIARTHSLRGNFDEAHRILDRVEKMLDYELKLARVRYLLERGRTFNSSKQPQRALPLFAEASDIAAANEHWRYAIDAVHMLAIAEPDPAKQVEWNLKGVAMVEAHPDQRGWLWSLYNNIAESHALLRDYQSSLDYTCKLLAFQKEKGEPDMYTLKDEARFLRLLGHADRALPLIEKLAEKHPDDPWIKEELAESRRVMGIA